MKSEIEKPAKFPIIVPEFVLNSELPQLNLWQTAVNAISKSHWWQLCLITFGSASSIIYPHVPLVGLAAVAGNTLTRKKALVSATSIWFANQLYGFTIRQYPRTPESLTWGIVMGLGMLLVTWIVTLRPGFSRHNWQGYLIWLAVSVVGGYAIYQGSIVLIAHFMGGHGLTAIILGRIFVRDATWCSLASDAGCASILPSLFPSYFSVRLSSPWLWTKRLVKQNCQQILRIDFNVHILRSWISFLTISGRHYALFNNTPQL
jgi:uncharacterized membrane protein (DUF485 family)